MNESARPARSHFLAIACVSCAMLMHEVLLTRICALRLQFHFAFLVISNCLLGLGAAGSVLSAHRERVFAAPARWLSRLSLGFLVALVVTYILLVKLPLPGEAQLSNPAHVAALSAFSLIGAVPLFFAGAVIGLLLSWFTRDADRLYASDLLGAGVGCIACPALLPLVGAGGVFVASALLAIVACLGVLDRATERRARSVCNALLVAALGLLPFFDRLMPVPSKPLSDIVLRDLSPERIRSVWTANSRIDLYHPPKCDAPLYMRGVRALVAKPKECAEIAQDATAATTISNFTDDPGALEYLRRSMYSAAYRLKDKPSVLVIGMGGGNDVWSAKANGARSVKAIELNWPIVDIHKRVLAGFSKALIDDPSVKVVIDEGRSALMRDKNTYDVVQMTGIDTWTALASGGYVMAENYLYTREAIISMYKHLKPGGIMQISRFAQAMEALRLLSNIDSALGSFGVKNIQRSVMVTATPDFMMSVQIKKGEFTVLEQMSMMKFADDNGIFVVYLPDRPLPGFIDDFVRAPDKQRAIDAFAEDISPTSDDRPYFFNFTKWRHPIESIRHIGDVPAISQGNPFFLLSQLLLSLVLSAALIIWPLTRQPHKPGRGALRLLAFFSSLGIGFISVEVALLQKLTLLLGQPVYSLTVTLFALLIFTGLGSLRVAPRFAPGARSIWLIPAGIAIYLALFNLGSGAVVSAAIGAALPWRIAVAVAMLAPLGLMLGVPFAYGLRVANEYDPQLIPWAWAINGCLSVVGSILTVVISMNFGFSVVLWSASVVYVLGFACLIPLLRGRVPS